MLRKREFLGTETHFMCSCPVISLSVMMCAVSGCGEHWDGCLDRLELPCSSQITRIKISLLKIISTFCGGSFSLHIKVDVCTGLGSYI